MAEVTNLPINEARPYYIRFLSLFPTAGRYWKFYAEHEVKSGNPKHAETIYTECLHNCLNVELWKSYISYVENRFNLNANNLKEDLNQTDLEQVIKVYDYAIQYVGKDVAATDVWRDLIRYIKMKKVCLLLVVQHDHYSRAGAGPSIQQQQQQQQQQARVLLLSLCVFKQQLLAQLLYLLLLLLNQHIIYSWKLQAIKPRRECLLIVITLMLTSFLAYSFSVIIICQWTALASEYLMIHNQRMIIY
jgi:hypothetical protein